MSMKKMMMTIALFVCSCIPDINLSECLQECKLDTSVCGERIEWCLDQCHEDIECAKDCTDTMSDCVDEQVNDELLGCVTLCIEEEEKKL